MSDYCTVRSRQEPTSHPPVHAPLVAAGVGDGPDKAMNRLALTEVVQRLWSGDGSYTEGMRTGKAALAEHYIRRHCRIEHIRSAPDATTAHNLDNLRQRHWTSKVSLRD